MCGQSSCFDLHLQFRHFRRTPHHRTSRVEWYCRLVGFWASWCAPCQQSFPWIQKTNNVYASQGLTIVAVNETNTNVKLSKTYYSQQDFRLLCQGRDLSKRALP